MIRKNLFSLLIALIIMYLSLAGSDNFDGVSFLNIPYFDKIVHFCMYFGLMLVMQFENRKQIAGLRRIIILSLIPFSYGILMEVFQELFTTTRTGSIYDVIFNTSGILVSALIWNWLKTFKIFQIK